MSQSSKNARRSPHVSAKRTKVLARVARKLRTLYNERRHLSEQDAALIMALADKYILEPCHLNKETKEQLLEILNLTKKQISGINRLYSELHPQALTSKRKRKREKEAARIRHLNPENNPVVYLVSNGKHLKIGMTSDIKKRLAALQTASPEELTILGLIPFQNRAQAKTAESRLHKSCKRYRRRGEWFSPDCLSVIQSRYPDLGLTPCGSGEPSVSSGVS